METVERTDSEPVQIDLYGIRVDVKPSPASSNEAQTWRDVWRTVHAQLRSIIVNVVGLANDTLAGARGLVRGIGGLPQSLSRRIQEPSTGPDTSERLAINSAAISPAHEALRRFLEKKQQDGVSIRIYEHGDALIVCVVGSNDIQRAKELAGEAAQLLRSFEPHESVDR